MPSNIWDIVGKAGEGALKAAVANQNAQNTLKSQLLLYKIKQQFEQQGKEKQVETKFKYDLAVKNAETPYQKWARETYEKEQAGGGGGSRRMVPGASGFTTEKVNIKDDILNTIAKGGQLTPGQLQIYNDTMKRKSGTNTISFPETPTNPTDQPTGQPNDITLPDTISTTSQAVKYLKDTYKLDDTQATDWLKQNIK